MENTLSVDNNKKEEYRRKSTKIYSYLCLDPQTARTIQLTNERDGVGAWNRIKGIFERKDPLRMAKLRQELNNIKMLDYENIDEYLTKIKMLKATMH